MCTDRYLHTYLLHNNFNDQTLEGNEKIEKKRKKLEEGGKSSKKMPLKLKLCAYVVCMCL